jgi:hypothetical protein
VLASAPADEQHLHAVPLPPVPVASPFPGPR